MTYHLAIDIGASGGRHILGYIANGKICTEEIYRFENGMDNVDGRLIWDTERLFNEVVCGIARCKTIGKVPVTVAIDTWGVDYVLLDKHCREIYPAYAYRDGETALVQEEVASLISPKELYSLTGIQHQNFNTIFRLYCDKKSGRLDNAAHMLMLPEYLSYKLTGIMGHEYTNATTTNLINAKTRCWDLDIIRRLGLPEKLFGELSNPSMPLGCFSHEITEKVGYNAEVIWCPSHDTASAVAACPLEGDGIFISSGTWSLVGAENEHPVLSEGARTANLTNEGGVCGTYRFLKNIMGMWLFQGIRKSLGKKYSYDEMMNLAKAGTYTECFDPNDERLTAPDDMLNALRDVLGDEKLPLGDVLSSVYHSLALSYAKTVKELEVLSGREFGAVHIIGGGSKDGFLNELTAKYTEKTVFAGPVEATALGNLLSQMMYLDKAMTLDCARSMIKDSFNITPIGG